MYDPVNTSHEIFDSAETWDVYSLLAHTDSFAASLSTAKDMYIYGSPYIVYYPCLTISLMPVCSFPHSAFFPPRKEIPLA
jgi:hypothetical protein